MAGNNFGDTGGLDPQLSLQDVRHDGGQDSSSNLPQTPQTSSSRNLRRSVTVGRRGGADVTSHRTLRSMANR